MRVGLAVGDAVGVGGMGVAEGAAGMNGVRVAVCPPAGAGRLAEALRPNACEPHASVSAMKSRKGPARIQPVPARRGEFPRGFFPPGSACSVSLPVARPIPALLKDSFRGLILAKSLNITVSRRVYSR